MSASVSAKNYELGYVTAMQLANAEANEALQVFYKLLRQRKLHAAVHEMNQLLEDQKHADLVMKAFRRIGLEHGG
jgi:hypothetical protein